MVYALAGTIAGAVAGAATGAMGNAVSDPVRFSLGTLLGAVAVGVGVRALRAERSAPLQCDRETPKEWVDRGPLAWPILNGAALGFGATTRLGFWLWYAIPIGCFLLAAPAAGAVIWGSYGLTRTAAAAVIWHVQARHRDHDLTGILSLRASADRAAASMTVVLGFAGLLLLGL